MSKKIIVYKNDAKFVGYIVKTSYDDKIVIVNIDGKEYVGRLVNSWVEI